ncbi:MAG: GNAT family N-acetyltransferase [Clostridia bacterium]|nr:GNAT family N-acetyltransferase [Clostridia bacterium]
MAYTINRVKQGDERALAHIQTESWKEAFREILPPEVLEKYTDFACVEAMYQRLLSNNSGNGYLLRVDHQPHCIAWWDASREADTPDYAELICIHSLPDRWRKGYGSRMMEHVLDDMASAGYQRVMLWVFADNLPARKFYEKHGFILAGREKIGLGAAEICYEKVLTQANGG